MTFEAPQRVHARELPLRLDVQLEQLPRPEREKHPRNGLTSGLLEEGTFRCRFGTKGDTSRAPVSRARRGSPLDDGEIGSVSEGSETRQILPTDERHIYSPPLRDSLKRLSFPVCVSSRRGRALTSGASTACVARCERRAPPARLVVTDTLSTRYVARKHRFVLESKTRRPRVFRLFSQDQSYLSACEFSRPQAENTPAL